MYRNDSSIDLCQKVKKDNYHLGQLNRPVSQIDIQCIMLGFLVEGHNHIPYSGKFSRVAIFADVGF